MKNINILVTRYKTFINDIRPDVRAIKDKSGSLELSHALWMLEKMSEADYKPKTTSSAWITWIQASLYVHGLICIKHEVDITREILKQKEKVECDE